MFYTKIFWFAISCMSLHLWNFIQFVNTESAQKIKRNNKIVQNSSTITSVFALAYYCFVPEGSWCYQRSLVLCISIIVGLCGCLTGQKGYLPWDILHPGCMVDNGMRHIPHTKFLVALYRDGELFSKIPLYWKLRQTHSRKQTTNADDRLNGQHHVDHKNMHKNNYAKVNVIFFSSSHWKRYLI